MQIGEVRASIVVTGFEMMKTYQRLYQYSIDSPQDFWRKAAQDISWIKKPTQILNQGSSLYPSRWFDDGICNTCYNCIDRHIENGHGEQVAVIYDSAMTNTVVHVTYAQLYDKVARLAGVLKDFGLEKGDRAIIYMPMIVECMVAMLACARLGVIHSVVFGGFAAPELATRISDSKPRIILTASCGLEPNRVVAYKPLVDEGIELSGHNVEHVLLLQREQYYGEMQHSRDIDWHSAMATAKHTDCVAVQSSDPLYILYTSGTTGMPKGIVRDNGGHMVALKWSMKHIYDIDFGDVYWAASDMGWVVGHSYIVYAPLLHGCTTVIYEGKPVGTPDAGAFWRVINDHKVKVLFTAPTAFRAIKKEDSEGELIKKYDLSSLKYLFLAGERSDSDTIKWAKEKLGVPVIDHWWQTETGWSIATNCVGIEPLPIKLGSSSRAAPGYDVCVLDEQGNRIAAGEMGSICIALPLPPSCAVGIWQAPERFHGSYFSRFAGYYETGDAGYIDEDGYIFIMSRTDDIINVAGHRLSTGALEEVLSEHVDVAECAVVGVKDTLKGHRPVGLLVLNTQTTSSESDIINESIARVRTKIGPVASFKEACVVQRLPKTRSGKILRATMRAIADGREYKIPATIDDPAILDEIAQVLAQLKLGKL